MFALCLSAWLKLTGTASVCAPLHPRVSVCPQRSRCPYSPSSLRPLKHPELLHAENWSVGGLSSSWKPRGNTLASHVHYSVDYCSKCGLTLTLWAALGNVLERAQHVLDRWVQTWGWSQLPPQTQHKHPAGRQNNDRRRSDSICLLWWGICLSTASVSFLTSVGSLCWCLDFIKKWANIGKSSSSMPKDWKSKRKPTCQVV